jgi:hypothetical protein
MTEHASVSEAAYGAADRLQHLILLGGATAILALARWLEPSARGFGTHQQLGLPSCAFLKLTGFPCPHCGLTTSFAHAARLHFVQAFLAQPFGLIAFLLTVISIPWLIFLIRNRISLSQLMGERWVKPTGYALIAAYFLGWIYKIAVMSLW